MQLKQTTSVFVVAFGLACFGHSPALQAVSPAPDGGYPGGNTAEGQAALLSRTTGGFNTAVGFLSLRSDTSNSFNTAIGAGALLANTADNNTATGAGALLSNTTGSVNTAYGAFALFHNTTGGGHTAVGYNALAATNASDFLEGNTAVGSSALANDTTGNANTAVGFGALFNNATGNSDTAIGNLTLGANNIGNNNTATGFSALLSNTSGNDNTASGFQALMNNMDGTQNTAIGSGALAANTGGGVNTAVGSAALQGNTMGVANVALGAAAGINATTGSFNVYIGAGENGIPGESHACYIASIFNQTSVSGVPVLISSNDKLGTMTSSRRFKDHIRPMDEASEELYALHPVTFCYKNQIDPAGISQFGLVAEDVEKVNPDLVVRDKEGKPFSVRYDQVNAMLLNEFLKQHRKALEQQKQIDTLKAELKEQKALIQKVSDQVGLSKPAPQTVLNNQ